MTNRPDLPQSWQDLAAVLTAGLDRLALVGPPGTGKTHAALHYLPAGQTHAERVTLTDDSTSAALEGLWRPSRDGWAYQEGPAVKAWRNGTRLVLDEVDKASGDTLGTLLLFCDSEGSARWTNPDTGEVVTPAPGFSVVITSNTDPRHLPDALRDRFPVVLEIREPHPDALDLLPAHLRDTARDLAQLDADDPNRASLRAMLALTKLAASIGWQDAARIVLPRHADAIAAAAAVESIAEGATA
jgi:MoxR-like ATPase